MVNEGLAIYNFQEGSTTTITDVCPRLPCLHFDGDELYSETFESILKCQQNAEGIWEMDAQGRLGQESYRVRNKMTCDPAQQTIMIKEVLDPIKEPQADFSLESRIALSCAHEPYFTIPLQGNRLRTYKVEDGLVLKVFTTDLDTAPGWVRGQDKFLFVAFKNGSTQLFDLEERESQILSLDWGNLPEEHRRIDTGYFREIGLAAVGLNTGSLQIFDLKKQNARTCINPFPDQFTRINWTKVQGDFVAISRTYVEGINVDPKYRIEIWNWRLRQLLKTYALEDPAFDLDFRISAEGCHLAAGLSSGQTFFVHPGPPPPFSCTRFLAWAWKSVLSFFASIWRWLENLF